MQQLLLLQLQFQCQQLLVLPWLEEQNVLLWCQRSFDIFLHGIFTLVPVITTENRNTKQNETLIHTHMRAVTRTLECALATISPAPSWLGQVPLLHGGSYHLAFA